MKKVLLLVVAVIFATSSFAQEFSAGLRVGSGFQAVGQLQYSDNCYLEARFGASWVSSFGSGSYRYNGGNDDSIGYGSFGEIGILDMTRASNISFDYYRPGVTVDLTLLHNWRILRMDWTPDYGDWFFDAGAGVKVGGKKNFAYVGIAGMARLGFNFPDVPITLAVDWTPSLGPSIIYGSGFRDASFNSLALADFGITCTYNF